MRFAVIHTVLALCLCAGAAQAKDDPAIPDFAPGTNIGWHAELVNFMLPPSGPHDVTEDPAYPFTPAGRGEAPQFRVADLASPILQPWVRDVLKAQNDQVIAGGSLFTRSSSCWPMGVPAILLTPLMLFNFIQTPKEVLLIQQLNSEVRHIYMNVAHSAHVKPSWYGESVGHYEGDTLVVDTIGLNAKTFVDAYRTPHSPKLHVVERFRLIQGGKVLEANVHVEDPGAYTTPWNAVQRLDREEPGGISEIPCAENVFNIGDVEPPPQADRLDF